MVKNPPAGQETLVQLLDWEDPLAWDRLPTPVFSGFPGSSDDKKSASNEEDLGSVTGLGRSPEEGMATHSNYCPENPHGQRSQSMGSQRAGHD